MRSASLSARPRYTAADRPARPPPTMITSAFSLGNFTARGSPGSNGCKSASTIPGLFQNGAPAHFVQPAHPWFFASDSRFARFDARDTAGVHVAHPRATGFPVPETNPGVPNLHRRNRADRDCPPTAPELMRMRFFRARATPAANPEKIQPFCDPALRRRLWRVWWLSSLSSFDCDCASTWFERLR